MRASLVTQLVKSPPAMRETRFRSLGSEDPLEKGMATQYSGLENSMDCSLPGSYAHEDSTGKNTGVGCHALLQGISPTQGQNQCLLHVRQTLYQLSHQGSPQVS